MTAHGVWSVGSDPLTPRHAAQQCRWCAWNLARTYGMRHEPAKSGVSRLLREAVWFDELADRRETDLRALAREAEELGI